jgi:hypothetical protein
MAAAKLQPEEEAISLPRDTCVLCGRSTRASNAPNLCKRCCATTPLPRLVTVTQLAAVVPALTEHKIRHFLQRRGENGLEAARVLYVPKGTNSIYIHLDRFERWFSGR